MELETLAALASIVVLDLTISGDNALVIGMAAHKLPPDQRRLAILLGAGGAIGLRVLFTALAAVLLTVPLLQAGGGILLAWVAYRLLTESTEGEGAKHSHGINLLDAIRIIVLADLVMSLDNILAVGGAAQGSLLLLLFGLALSMPIVLVGSGLVAAMMSRARWLVHVGAVVLAWTAGQMILEDHVVGAYLPDHWVAELALATLIGAAVFVASIGGRRRRDEAGA